MEDIIKNINKNNSSITKWDTEYCNLLKKIKKEGELFENRTGIDTISIEGYNFKLDVGKEFPILESKKVNIMNALSEILWIYQAQSNKVNWLKERKNNIWNEWEIDEDGIYRTYEPNDKNPDEEKKVIVTDLEGINLTDKYGNPLLTNSTKEGKTIKTAKYFGKEYKGTIGTAYGWINNYFKRPQYVLNQLKNNPHDRRMIISLWQDEYLKTAVLPSCVWSTEWKVYKGKLNAYVHQRSADVPLGLPFNVSQYAILLNMFAKVSNLEPGSLNWSIMDAHIYVNQIDGINTQLKRFELMKKYEKMIKEETPKDINHYYKTLQTKETQQEILNINNSRAKKIEELNEQKRILELMLTKEKPELVLADKNNFFDFDNTVNTDKEYLKENITGNEDIKVRKYTSAPFIKMPIAQ